MPRLIELTADQELPDTLRVQPGDLIIVDASGGRLSSDGGAIEMIGTFTRSLAPGGHVIAPMGAPNAVLMRACSLGSARVDLVVGDPRGSPTRSTLQIYVAE